MKTKTEEWTDKDGCSHRREFNPNDGMVHHGICIQLPLINRGVGISHRFNPLESQNIANRIIKRSKFKLAKMARLEFHRYIAKKLSENKAK